jgi:hypothetical protein
LGIYDVESLVSITAYHQTFGGKIWRAAALVQYTFVFLRMTLLFQQRSVIRYYCLRGKTNIQIVTKLKQSYYQDALRLQVVEKWAARFRAGQETIKDDERPARPPQNDLGDAVPRFLEKQPHSSSREINRVLCSPRTTILRLLDDLRLRFFAPRWIPHRLSDAQKADRVELSQHLLDMMQARPETTEISYNWGRVRIYSGNQRRGM